MSGAAVVNQYDEESSTTDETEWIAAENREKFETNGIKLFGAVNHLGGLVAELVNTEG
jgi:hypothetical protein